MGSIYGYKIWAVVLYSYKIWTVVLYSYKIWAVYVKQNNILRNMTFSNYDTQRSPIYKTLNFLKVQDIYKLELAKLILRFQDGLLLNIYFRRSSDLHNYNTRYTSSQDYFIPSIPSNIGKILKSYRGAVYGEK